MQVQEEIDKPDIGGGEEADTEARQTGPKEGKRERERKREKERERERERVRSSSSIENSSAGP